MSLYKSAAWFNDQDYSDLTLKLSDDREIKVHKVVLCKQNSYFASLCGSSSSFSEANQSVIKLEGDNPDALEEVLRHIYGCALPAVGKDATAWRLWFDIVITANKYLEPDFSNKACKILRSIAMEFKDTDQVFDIIQSVQRKAGHIESLLELADALRRTNIMELQKNKRYREALFGDRSLMESHLDDLNKLVIPRKVVCGTCLGRWPPAEDQGKHKSRGGWS